MDPSIIRTHFKYKTGSGDSASIHLQVSHYVQNSLCKMWRRTKQSIKNDADDDDNYEDEDGDVDDDNDDDDSLLQMCGW